MKIDKLATTMAIIIGLRYSLDWLLSAKIKEFDSASPTTFMFTILESNLDILKFTVKSIIASILVFVVKLIVLFTILNSIVLLAGIGTRLKLYVVFGLKFSTM